MNRDLSALSLHDLRAMTALADELHFGRAAERCGVSQPSLSATVRKVENALGLTIFQRTSRRCEVSREGAFVVHQIRKALESLRPLEMGADEGIVGQVRLGAIPTIGPYWLPQILKPLLEKCPNIEVVLSEGTTDLLVDQVLEGELDIAVVSTLKEHRRLSINTIFYETLKVAVPAADVAEHEDSIELNELRPMALLLLEKQHCLSKQTRKVCHVAESSTRTFLATGLHTVLFMVQIGAGYTLVPEMAVPAVESMSGVRVLSLLPSEPTREVNTVIRKDRANDPAIQAVLKELADLSASLGGSV